MEYKQIAGSQQGAGEALSLMCPDIEQVAFPILLCIPRKQIQIQILLALPRKGGGLSIQILLYKLHKIQKN